MVKKLLSRDACLDYVYKQRSKNPNYKLCYLRPWWLALIFKLIYWYNWDSYTLTIGSSIYVSQYWERYSMLQKMEILRHENVHIEQYRRFTIPLMLLMYLFLPLPIGFALCRALFEREALVETIKARIEYRGDSTEVYRSTRESYMETFMGPSYFWAFPFKSIVSKWFEKDWAKAIASSK